MVYCTMKVIIGMASRFPFIVLIYSSIFFGCLSRRSHSTPSNSAMAADVYWFVYDGDVLQFGITICEPFYFYLFIFVFNKTEN